MKDWFELIPKLIIVLGTVVALYWKYRQQRLAQRLTAPPPKTGRQVDEVELATEAPPMPVRRVGPPPLPRRNVPSRAAVHREVPVPVVQPSPPPTTSTPLAAYRLRELMKDRENLRAMFLLREILAPPRCLRR
jgi:hypothetical protein